jgi:hypothetical protein
MNQLYSVGEARNRIREIQTNVREGLVSGMVNHATNESTIMISPLMLEGILETLPVVNVTEYDEEMKIYTIYNEIIPHFYGEGLTQEEAAKNLLKEAIAFSREYMENISTFSRLFNGLQQFIMGVVLLNIEDEKKIMEILKIA